MSATLEIDSSSKGSVAVPAKLLLEILKTFPEQPLTFTVEENNTIEISSNSGKYAVAYAAAEEFPKSVNLEEPSTTLVPADVLATAISKTIFAAGLSLFVVVVSCRDATLQLSTLLETSIAAKNSHQ